MGPNLLGQWGMCCKNHVVGFLKCLLQHHPTPPTPTETDQLDPHFVTWIADYLTGRPQFVRMGGSVYTTATSSTRARPRGLCCHPLLYASSITKLSQVL